MGDLLNTHTQILKRRVIYLEYLLKWIIKEHSLVLADNNKTINTIKYLRKNQHFLEGGDKCLLTMAST
jgi:hypothetical protein